MWWDDAAPADVLLVLSQYERHYPGVTMRVRRSPPDNAGMSRARTNDWHATWVLWKWSCTCRNKHTRSRNNVCVKHRKQSEGKNNTSYLPELRLSLIWSSLEVRKLNNFHRETVKLNLIRWFLNTFLIQITNQYRAIYLFF